MSNTLALRFADNFAPDEGTVQAHLAVIAQLGYVWYGKLGSPVSESVVASILNSENPKILLIHSGSSERYWADVTAIQRDTPSPKEGIPDYYSEKTDKVGCWFKLTNIEEAPRDVMSKYVVVSSGKRLTEASRYSMSPYFIITPAQ